ncbi:FecR family protein [Undibacterium sp. RuTC16W]|uniref:FecR family protein n=1 Tax=Undibacterium sp. RuTC16W TaxID=3413048 RepID=UPI003BF062B0
MNKQTLRTPANHEVIEAEAASWVAKQDNVEAWTPIDETTLQVWLSQHTAHRVAWLRLRQSWNRANQMHRLPPETARNIDDIQTLAIVAPRRLGIRLVTKAAYLCGLALIGILAFRGNETKQSEERYVTAVGARQELTLEDGSHVILNTRTRARAVVNGDERKFWLDEGEAFFEIEHDPLHPFVVTAGQDRITVLGTKFSVRHEGGVTRVVVVEGRVAVDSADASTLKGAAKSTMLARNDSAVSEMGKTTVAKVTSQMREQELSWRDSVLIFDNKSLAEIAAEFNRYNRRQLVVKSDAGTLVVSGKMDVHNVDGFVRLIHTGFGVVVRAEGDQIYLSMN